jgi:formylglycine-generating enzyme required for sulfatase activity
MDTLINRSPAIKTLILLLLFTALPQLYHCNQNPVSSSTYPKKTFDCSRVSPSPQPINSPDLIYVYTEIFNADSELVKEGFASYTLESFAASGGYIYWNGNDTYGNKVPSGYYTIKASIYRNQSSSSTCNKLYVSDGTVPLTPSNLKVTSLGRKIEATWDPVDKVYSYFVYYQRIAPLTSAMDSVETFAPADTIVKNIYAGSTYAVWVAASNGSVRSSACEPETIFVPFQIPAQPTIVSVRAIDSKAILWWKTDPEALSYRMYYTSGKSVDTTVEYMETDTTPDTLSGLKNGIRYSVAIAALNPAGMSYLSQAYTVCPALPQPDSISAAPGDSSLIFHWKSVPNATSYSIYCDTIGKLDTLSHHFVVDSSCIEIKSLIPGKTYSYAITAHDSTSQSALVLQKNIVVLSIPRMTVTQVDGNTVIATWNKIPGASMYEAYFSTGAILDTTKSTGFITDTIWKMPNLVPGTIITFALRTKRSTYENQVKIEYGTPISTPIVFLPRPAAPVMQLFTGDKMGIITIDSPRTAQEFIIYLMDSEENDTFAHPTIFSTPVCTLTNLKNRTTYSGYAAYRIDTLRSLLSKKFTLYPDYTIPDSLQAKEEDGQVTLSWKTIPGAISYNVYYAVGSTVGMTGLKVSTIGPPLTIRSLINDTLYAFAVSAVSEAESKLSTVDTARPFLYSPYGITAFPKETSIEILWIDPIDTLFYALYWQEGDTVSATTGNRVDRIKPPYLLNGLTTGKRYSFYCSSLGSVESKPSTIVSAVPQFSCLDCGMKRINGGTFLIGDSSVTINQGAPEHYVTISTFLIDSTEVTANDFSSLMGGQKNQGMNYGPRCPAGSLLWYDAILYCNKRSRRDGLDSAYRFSSILFNRERPWLIDSLLCLVCDFSKNGYRLPTEPEWEYACRGGTRTKYPWGDTLDTRYYNLSLNSQKFAVASLLPNQYGLYDMLGNTYELTTSKHDYTIADATDPEGSISGGFAMVRGGGAGESVLYMHPSVRLYYPKSSSYLNIGFRVVRREK